GRPFGSIGAPTPSGPTTTPGAPDDGTPPPGSPPSSPRRLVPNPYVVLPPPSSLTVEVPVVPAAGSSPAEPGPPLAVDAAPGAFDPGSPDAPWSLEPTEAEIRLATALAERGRDQLASGA